MSRTNYAGPMSVGQKTGNNITDTRGWTKLVKQVSVGFGAARQIVSFPKGTTILNIGAVPTSAFTGGTDVHDMNINFGTSADSQGLGVVQVSTRPNCVKARIECRQVSLNASGHDSIELPPKSTLLRLGSIETSTWTPADAASAGVTNFGTGSADVGHYGIVTGASARASIVFITPVSGATEFDTGGTIYVSCSAVSTNVTTGGGVRAFVEYAVADSDSGIQMKPVASGAASFDTSGGSVVVTISAAATSAFTAGGVRAIIEYVVTE